MREGERDGTACARVREREGAAGLVRVERTVCERAEGTVCERAEGTVCVRAEGTVCVQDLCVCERESALCACEREHVLCV